MVYNVQLSKGRGKGDKWYGRPSKNLKTMFFWWISYNP